MTLCPEALSNNIADILYDKQVFIEYINTTLKREECISITIIIITYNNHNNKLNYNNHNNKLLSLLITIVKVKIVTTIINNIIITIVIRI